MKFVKVTDGAVTRFYDLENPKSAAVYKELVHVNHNTGYNVVVDNTGKPKEFTEAEVKEQIAATRKASAKPQKTVSIPAGRTVVED